MDACVAADVGACVTAVAGAGVAVVVDAGGTGARVVVAVVVDTDAAERATVALWEVFDFAAGPFPFAMGCNHFSSSIL